MNESAQDENKKKIKIKIILFSFRHRCDDWWRRAVKSFDLISYSTTLDNFH